MSDASGRQIAALQRLVAQMRQRVEFVENSAFWKVRAGYFTLKKRLGFVHDPAPPAIPAQEYVETQRPQERYCTWLLEHEPRRGDLERMAELVTTFALRPTFAIVVDDAGDHAESTLASAAKQVYPAVAIVRTSQSAGVAATQAKRLNAALESVDADWIVCLEAGEELRADALFDITVALNAGQSFDACYSDRDEILADGSRANPSFVSEFAPESLLSSNAIGDVVFYRRATLRMLDGYAETPAPRLDLALRASEANVRFAHRPHILWHRPAQSAAERETRWTRQARTVELACARRGTPARCERFRQYPGSVIPRFTLERPGKVEIIIPTRDRARDLEIALRSVFEHSQGLDFRVTVVDNGSTEPETAGLLEKFSTEQSARFQTLHIDEPFNFSQLINAGVRATDGPYVVLLNNDTEILTDDWLVAMLEYAQQPAIGAVGSRLLYGDGRVQHAGVVVGLGKLAGHVYRFAPPDDPGPAGEIFSIRNYSAVTAAALAVRRDAFERIDGFDESFAVEFNDVDFCLRLGQLGLRNVYLPHVEIRHYESQTRGRPDTPWKRARMLSERALFEERWHTATFRDPYYNPNLTLDDETGSLAL